MVTGDHSGTALGVARMLGLVGQDARAVEGRSLAELDAQALLAAPVFARVDPAQKLRLVERHQQAGSVVAMTGDGVNDAPALRRADIGVAMGRRGTQVAREAADMVLHDDSFTSIVRAIHQGRTIFTNIRRFTVYLLSCNISEVALVFAATVAGGPLPLLPLQILYLNLVTDVFPALALGFGEGAAATMQRPPRDPREPIVTRQLWLAILCYVALIAGAVLGALFAALHVLDLDEHRAITVSFLALALAQVWHVFDMRERGSALVRNDVVRSPWVWGAVVLCLLLLLLAVHGPVLPAVLGTADPGVAGWALALGASVLPALAGQVWLSRPMRG
jgi:Ca2+-transporting ATPase